MFIHAYCHIFLKITYYSNLKYCRKTQFKLTHACCNTVVFLTQRHLQARLDVQARREVQHEHLTDKRLSSDYIHVSEISA